MWLKYWQIAIDMMKVPKDQRERVYGDAMTGPALQQLLGSATYGDSKHVANYGTIKHDVRWGPAVDGKDVAVMADCQDESQFGIIDVKTNQPVTVGPKHVNVQATFKRTAVGWKVYQFFVPKGTTC